MLARARYARSETFGDFRQKCQNAQKRRKFWRFSSKVSKATRRQKSSKWSKALGFWQRPKFLKSGQNFRASKILPSDYDSIPLSKRIVSLLSHTQFHTFEGRYESYNQSKRSKNTKDKQLFTTICFIYKNPISGEGPSDLCSLARSS